MTTFFASTVIININLRKLPVEYQKYWEIFHTISGTDSHTFWKLQLTFILWKKILSIVLSTLTAFLNAHKKWDLSPETLSYLYDGDWGRNLQFLFSCGSVCGSSPSHSLLAATILHWFQMKHDAI